MSDARFRDAPMAARPLRLWAAGPEDLTVIASLMQDAVGRTGDVVWLPRRRRLVLLMNRFRWEEAVQDPARRLRVRAALTIDSVLRVRSRGVDPKDRDAVLALLTLGWQPGADGAGTLNLTLSGGGDLGVDVECLDLTLADLTASWSAPTDTTPDHGA